MSRTRIRKSLSALIALAVLTSCSSSDNASKSTTTTESQSVIEIAQSCLPKDGFCIDFPMTGGGVEPRRTTHLNDGFYPKSTAYVTEVYPGDEVEQYAVYVFVNSAETQQTLVEDYKYQDCEMTAGLEPKASICTRTSTDPGFEEVNMEMLVGTHDTLWLVQASTMSINPPTYAKEFFDSFKLQAPPPPGE